MEYIRDIDTSRGIVLCDYQSATLRNKEAFDKKDVKASSEYIFSNQKEDASIICNKFYQENIRAIGIVKRTKIGNDGLMIELAKNMTTHSDDEFVLHRDDIFVITAMSNKSWEDDLKDKIPACFKDNVYHHGKLQNLKDKLINIKNALIIIDEIDSGDKEDQKLHLLLKDSGVLDMKYMDKNNIRFVFVSATIINELRELYKWGDDKYYTHYMTIPPTYIGHKEFLEQGIIQEYYPIKDLTTAERWIEEDILNNYENDYRVHIIRSDKKNMGFIIDACIKKNIKYKNHTSDDRISYADFKILFDTLSNHTVIIVKDLYRRANLIPNQWKKKIGATHERYVKKPDTNVQVQGLIGRMSGYWKPDIENGHKTGPYRSSIESIKQYEEFYKNPFGKIKYDTSLSKSFVNPKHIQNLTPIHPNEVNLNAYRIYDSEDVVKKVCKSLGYDYRPATNNLYGFKETSLNRKKEVVSLQHAISKVPTAYGKNKGIKTWRTYYPCYVDITDSTTLRFVVIIRPDTDINKVKTEIDTIHQNLFI
jgi:hypothetical protein